jgi:hypothetical protein
MQGLKRAILPIFLFLFAYGADESLAMLEGKIREGHFFYISIS